MKRHRLIAVLASLVMLASFTSELLADDPSPPAAKPAAGPLRVHPTNPRYFTDGSKRPDGTPRAIYLTGSHTWDNFQRWFEGEVVSKEKLTAGKPGPFENYLKVLDDHGHNFIRLWVADSAWSPITKAAIEPQPYIRVGPGKAADGQPTFDLNQLNPAYFAELRSRVGAARERGMYVSVMLFNGWGISRYTDHGRHHAWPYHPFHKGNNVNGIDGDVDGDNRGLEYNRLQVPAITRLQETYVRKVVDTVNDLDNVLYEISNESMGDSREWQQHITRLIQEYEAKKGKQHPILSPFDTGTAEAITPSNMGDDPAATTGAKVAIVDSDHNGSFRRDPGYAWRVFLRGGHPIVMDWWTGSSWEPIRQAMGQTRALSEKINLAAMTPRNSLSSTKYCLADPGSEYLVYQPASKADFTLALEAGDYDFEWFNPAANKVAETGRFSTKKDSRPFTAPFSGEAVLVIRRSASRQGTGGT